MEDTKTFIANIRCDYRYIAKIGKFLASNGVFMGTTSKLASEAIRIIAHGIPDKFECIQYGEAIRDLRLLGYKEELTDKVRYYKTLTESIKLEEEQEASQLSLNQEALRLTKEFNEKYSSSTPAVDRARADAVLAPTENKSEPEPEAPQLKTRTSDDEKKDISKLKTAMSNFSGAPVAE